MRILMLVSGYFGLMDEGAATVCSVNNFKGAIKECLD